MSVLQKLFRPSGLKFYNLFDESGHNLQAMAALFVQLLQETDIGKRDAGVAQMEKLEHENDHVTHRLFTELGKNFITPFDREDIYTLSGTQDDIADYMLGVVKLMKNYQLMIADGTSHTIALGIQDAVKQLTQALHELRNKSALNSLFSYCVETRKITVKLDNLIDDTITSLLHTETEPIQVVKMMDYYELMQALIGKCDDAVDVIESVIIKYA